MVKVNNKNEIFIKILYWGPESAGKTKILDTLHQLTIDKGVMKPTGEITKTPGESGATIYFDRDILVDKEDFFNELQPKGLELEDERIIKNIPIDFQESKYSDVYFQIFTVGGNPAFKSQRKKIYSGTDGILFVVDGKKSHWQDNVESLKELKEYAGKDLITKIPLMVMLNKSDLKDRISKAEIKQLFKDEGLMFESKHPNYMWNPAIFETIALIDTQKGIYESFYETIRRTGLYLKYGKIHIPRGEETVRINLTIPRSLKREWDEFAKQTLKTSLSQMIRNAVRQYRNNYGLTKDKIFSERVKDSEEDKIEKIVAKKFQEMMEKFDIRPK